MGVRRSWRRRAHGDVAYVNDGRSRAWLCILENRLWHFDRSLDNRITACHRQLVSFRKLYFAAAMQGLASEGPMMIEKVRWENCGMKSG